MMHRLIFAACCLAAMPLAVQAEGDVTPGLWSYEASAALGPFPVQDAGTHCVDRNMADASYETLFNDINPACTVTDGAQQADGYHFTLRCAGGPDGELTGRLTVQGDAAQLNATGWTGSPEQNMPVILSASARKLAPTCS